MTKTKWDLDLYSLIIIWYYQSWHSINKEKGPHGVLANVLVWDDVTGQYKVQLH